MISIVSSNAGSLGSSSFVSSPALVIAASGFRSSWPEHRQEFVLPPLAVANGLVEPGIFERRRRPAGQVLDQRDVGRIKLPANPLQAADDRAERHIAGIERNDDQAATISSSYRDRARR